MPLRVRYFFVGEDDYAGKSLRFIEAVVDRDDDGQEELVNAYFLRHQFDEHRLWDRNEKDRHMQGAVKAVSAVGKGGYMEELSRLDHLKPFGWKPSAELRNRLLAAIQTKKRHNKAIKASYVKDAVGS